MLSQPGITLHLDSYLYIYFLWTFLSASIVFLHLSFYTYVYLYLALPSLAATTTRDGTTSINSNCRQLGLVMPNLY